MMRCPECDGTDLSWATAPNKTVCGVADGRLRMNEVETVFYLGCEECSETLIHSVSADDVATFLTDQKWRPPANRS
jgi:hypothetical protein